MYTYVNIILSAALCLGPVWKIPPPPVIIDTLQCYKFNPVPGRNKNFLHLYYEKIKQKFSCLFCA